MLRATYQGSDVALKLAGEANSDLTDRDARYAQRELTTLRSLHHDSIVRVSRAMNLSTFMLKKHHPKQLMSTYSSSSCLCSVWEL